MAWQAVGGGRVREERTVLSAAQLFDQAVSHLNEGRFTPGLRALDRAEQRSPDPELRARMAGTRAYALAERGDPAAAVALCETALSTTGLSAATRAAVTGQLGLVLIHAGDLARAARVLDEAAGGLREDPRQLGNVLLNRGVLALESGDIATAEPRLRAARDAFEEADRPIGAAKARHGLGIVAQQQGDLVTARTELDAARETLAPLGPVMAAWSDLARADLLVSAGMPRGASQLLTDAAQAFGLARMRRQQAETELTIALTQRLLDPSAAERTARQARHRFARAEDPVGVLRAESLEVQCALEAGATGARRTRLLGRAVDVGAALAAAGLDDEARTLRRHRAGALASGGELAVARSELNRLRPRPEEPLPARVLHHEVRARVAAAAGRPREALRRAAAGVDLVTGWQQEFTELELRSSLAVHTRRLLELGIERSLALADPEAVLAWSELSRGVVARAMRVRPQAAHRPDVVVDLPSLEATLARDDAVLVSLIGTDRTTAAVVVDPGHPMRLVDLGPWRPIATTLESLHADLDMAAAVLPRGLAEAVAGSLRRRLREAADTLLAPLSLPPRARLVITASPALSAVPWGLLPGLEGVAVTVAETVRDWLRRAGEPPVSRARAAAFVVGPGLRNAPAEVAASAAAWADRARVLGPDAATREAVATAAREVDVLHVASHGRHWAENPLFSAFDLADGAWHGYDIEELEQVPQVVVLASCELGRSSGIWGDETIGMVRAWLHAGVRCVVASAARVPDTASGAVVLLHEALSQGRHPAAVLADAVGAQAGAPGLDVARTASFSCFGNGW